MNHIAIARQSAQAHRPINATFAGLERLKGQLAAWSARRCARAALLSLGDAELKDLGISRVQARFEHSKPIWRD